MNNCNDLQKLDGKGFTLIKSEMCPNIRAGKLNKLFIKIILFNNSFRWSNNWSIHICHRRRFNFRSFRMEMHPGNENRKEMKFLIFLLYFMTSFYKKNKHLQRDPTKIAPLMILLAISAVFSIITIFTGTFVGILNGVINCSINAYALVVLHSLFNVFNMERENR